MGLYDDLFTAQYEAETGKVATEEPPEPEPVPMASHNGQHAPPSKHAYLYVDLETCPDYDRLDQFDLPKLPPRKDVDLMSAAEFCSQGLAEIRKFFDDFLPPDSWLDNVEAEERASKKPRTGLFEAVAKCRGLADAQRKTLSVTPEYCRIVAAAGAFGNDKIEPTVVNSIEDEVKLLEEIWWSIAQARTLVGFNILHFDLPVILVRSALLGITPSRRINLSPYRNTEVCDLMMARWPKGGQMKLKAMARSLGIEIPAYDCDGSQVEHLYKTDPDKLRAYVTSDVSVTRDVHRTLSGYFWE